MTALRQALASRADYTFGGALPKDFMLGQAAERNRVALPKVDRAHGLVLPPEKYCLTGATWGLKDEWESEEDEVEAEDGMVGVVGQGEDEKMGGLDNGVQEEDEDEDEEGLGTMEDVFGEEKEGGDTDMKED